MRNLILLLCMIFIASCCSTKGSIEKVIVYDTVYETKVETIFLDYCSDSLLKVNAVLLYERDSLLALNAQLADKLLLSRKTIEDIRYYHNIVKKNNSQLKFLVGWLNRPLSEYK